MESHDLCNIIFSKYGSSLQRKCLGMKKEESTASNPPLYWAECELSAYSICAYTILEYACIR